MSGKRLKYNNKWVPEVRVSLTEDKIHEESVEIDLIRKDQ